MSGLPLPPLTIHFLFSSIILFPGVFFLFTHSFKKYLLRVYYVSSASLDAEDQQRTKTLKAAALGEFTFCWWRLTMNSRQAVM